MSIYVNQTNLKITVSTGADLTNVTTTLIKFTKPNGLKGQWSATPTLSNLEYNIVTGDLNIEGTWTVWAYVVYSNGKISIGEPAEIIVKKEGL